MTASLHVFRSRAQREHAERRDRLRQDMLAFPELPEEPVREVLRRLAQQDAHEPERWKFVMISPADNAAVIQWLHKNSSRPMQAVELWSHVLCVFRGDTGEILETRDEMAQFLGTSAYNVSRIMSELEHIGAIARERRRVSGQKGPGRVVYKLLPDVATTLKQGVRESAQHAARQNAATARPSQQKLEVVK